MIDNTKFFSKQENVKKLAEKVLEIGKANPDFVYKDFDEPGRCSYNNRCVEISPEYKKRKQGPDCPGCLLGQALQSLGVSVTSMNAQIEKYIPANFDLYGLDVCQNAQDTGKSFGEAIKHITI